ncbi:type II toxin-antitoxin system VapC family toxin [soil metagenome]
MTVLVDTNVLVDFLDGHSEWTAWAVEILGDVGATHSLVVNPIIYAELSVGYSSIDLLDEVLEPFEREELPWPAGFHAGKAFLAYRRAGGAKTSPLPDFYIGAHAQVCGYSLITRDAARYRTYFPGVQLITPERA